ncbi:putative Transmembrane protein [Quillaja saponaria]|uniref:Transmembrane protein n=1 Tax=Quillaja saponaria TaxID=32244 RepID=A0AAD7KXV9_QUISA|nr:putative Transmembrane protein [Quillaja saponaria]
MITSIAFSIFFLLSVTLLDIATAQGRAPHGLVYENPVAFPPSAYDFFHPNTQQPQNQDPCHASKCSPMSIAAEVEATQAYGTKALASPNGVGRKQLGIGGVTGVVFGFAFAVLLAMSVYYVVAKRRANMNKSATVQPDA